MFLLASFSLYVHGAVSVFVAVCSAYLRLSQRYSVCLWSIGDVDVTDRL